MEIGRTRWLTTALLVTVFIPVGTPAKDKPQFEQGKRIVQSALEKVNIWEAGTPPFRLQGSVEVFPDGAKKNAYQGTVLLTWFGPGEWRETITLPTVTQVRVATQGKVATIRTGQGGGLEVLRIEAVIDMRTDWTLWDDDRVPSPKSKKAQAADSACVDVAPNGVIFARQLCVDPTTSIPVSVRRAGPDGDVVKYADYAAWGGKQVPRSIQLYRNDRKEVDLRVESILSNGATASSQLSVSADGFEWDSCDDPHPAKVISSPPPQYPEAAREAGKSGDVIVYMVIARDGTPHNLQVVESPGPELAAETLRAISKWRFRPAMCGANAVPSESTQEVDYTLSE